jgi:hypothetical protein
VTPLEEATETLIALIIAVGLALLYINQAKKDDE